MFVYNLFALCGCVAGMLVLATSAPGRRLPLFHAFALPMVLLVISRWAARFFRALESGSTLSRWDDYFSFGPGHTSQFAGLYPSIAVVCLYALAARLRPLSLLDRVVPAAAVAIAFGRVGCLLAGCCPGILLPFRWTTWSAIPNPYNFPAPLVEGIAALLLFGYLQRRSRGSPPIGELTGSFFLLHGACRFLCQLIRVDEVTWGPLNSTQVLAIPLVIAGAVLLDRSRAESRTAIRDRSIGFPARA